MNMWWWSIHRWFGISCSSHRSYFCALLWKLILQGFHSELLTNIGTGTYFVEITTIITIKKCLENKRQIKNDYSSISCDSYDNVLQHKCQVGKEIKIYFR